MNPDDVQNGAADLADKLAGLENLGNDEDDDFMAGIDAAVAAEEGAKAPASDDAPEPVADEKPEGEDSPEPADDWDPLSTDDKPEPEEEEVPEAEADDEPPENLSEKLKPDWDTLRSAKKAAIAEAKEARREKEAIQAELAKLREEAADLAELREQKELFEEAQKELSISRVEGTVEYKQTIVTPLKTIEDQVVAIAKANEVDANKLFDAMTEADPATRRQLLKAATEDMDSVDQTEVFQMARDAQALLVKKEEIRANAHEAAKESKQNAALREAAEAKKAKEEYEANVKESISELRKRTPFKELKPGETEDNVYAALEKKAKETDFSSLTGNQKALAVAALLHSPRTLKQLQEANALIATLESRLSRKKATTPSVGDKTTPSKPDTSEMDDYFGNDGVTDLTARYKAMGLAWIATWQVRYLTPYEDHRGNPVIFFLD